MISERSTGHEVLSAAFLPVQESGYKKHLTKNYMFAPYSLANLSSRCESFFVVLSLRSKKVQKYSYFGGHAFSTKRKTLRLTQLCPPYDYFSQMRYIKIKTK